MKLHKVITLLFTFTLLGCNEEFIDLGPLDPVGQVTNGLYILNEGAFGDPEGARLSLYDIDRDTVYNNVYERANSGAHLGSLGDDLRITNDMLYVLMSGSENIAVLNMEDHKIMQAASYPGAAPHDLAIDVDRGLLYMTMLFSSSVLRVDLATLEPIDTFQVGNNPQGMLLVGDKLFVCNSGYGADSTVSVIDVVSGSIVATVSLTDGPTGAVFGPDGRVWIACTGNAFGMPPSVGAVYILDPVTGAIEDSVLFLENLWGSIAADNAGNVYVLGVTSGSFFGGPVHKITSATRAVVLNFIAGTFYAMVVDPVSGEIYLSNANDFASDGFVEKYDVTGFRRESFTVGKGPGAFSFRR
jgi:hypothetical protein